MKRWARPVTMGTVALGAVLVAAWITTAGLTAGKQRVAADAIRARGGVVYYECDARGFPQSEPEAGGGAWLRRILGQDFLHHVVVVTTTAKEQPEQFDVHPDTSEEFLGPLEALHRLRSISLHSHQVSDATLEVLGNIEDLESVYLVDASQVTDRGVEYLRGLKKLRCLLLSKSQVTDRSLEVLSGISTITGLYLSGHDFTDRGLAHLAGMKQLRSLAVCGPMRSNGITDSGLLHLKALTHLRSLRLQYTLVSDQGLTHLSGFSQLGSLSLHGTQVTPKGLEVLAQARPDLKLFFKRER